MIAIRDTGLVPEPLYGALARQATLADHVQSRAFDIAKFADLAFAASDGRASHLPCFKNAIASEHALVRYWGIVGLRVLREKASAEAASLVPLLKDKYAVNRSAAAEALRALGKKHIIVQSVENKHGRGAARVGFDRGINSEKNLQWLRQRGACYLVGTPKSELCAFESRLTDQDWPTVLSGTRLKCGSKPTS